LPDEKMVFDEGHGYWLPPDDSGGSGTAAGTHEAGTAEEGPYDLAGLRRAVGRLLLAMAITATLAVLILVAGVGVVPDWLLGLAATGPILLTEFVAGVLRSGDIAIPARFRSTLARRFRAVLGYAVLLLVVSYAEGALLRADAGSVPALVALNIGTGIVLGVLIGWRSPQTPISTIVQASLVASLLGGSADLAFLGQQRFLDIHGGGPLVLVILVNGIVFAASGILGYIGLRAGRLLKTRGGLAALPVVSRRIGIGAGLLAVLALTGSAGYALGSASQAVSATGAAVPPGRYLVNREISEDGGIVLTLQDVQVTGHGHARFALIYRNTGPKSQRLSCQGLANPGLAVVTLRDGELMHSFSTYCYAHPGRPLAIAAAGDLLSYASFPGTRGLGQPFAFTWPADGFSGTVTGIELSRQSAVLGVSGAVLSGPACCARALRFPAASPNSRS
jgi:hypothetical protein